MKTTVTKRGQTVVPSGLRRKYKINQDTTLEWIDTGVDIRIIPLPKDLIGALRGSAKGERLTERLLKARAETFRFPSSLLAGISAQYCE